MAIGPKSLARPTSGELAIAQYKRSLAIDASYISAHTNLALAYEKAGGRDAEAVATWGRVLEMGTERRLPHYVEIATRHLQALVHGREAEGEGVR